MTFAEITTLPKSLIIFPHLTRAKHGQITPKNSRLLHIHKSSHGNFFLTHTVDLFKIQDVNQWLKRRHGAPAFQTIFN